MKSRRKPLHTLFWASCILASLLAAYLRFGIFPGELKKHAVNRIRKMTGHEVLFDKTVYIPFQGLTFYNLHVADEAGRTVFSSRQLGVDARALPFLFEKKIVLSRIMLEGPLFDLSLKRPKAKTEPPAKTLLSGQIEVPVIPEEMEADWSLLQDGPNIFMPENVYLEGIDIRDGTVVVRPEKGLAPIEEVRALDVRLKFSKRPILDLQGSFKLGPVAYASASFRGLWNLELGTYDLQVSSKAARAPAWMAAYLKEAPIHWEAGVLKLKTRLTSRSKDQAVFHTEADLEKGRIRIRDGSYSGQISAETTGVFDFSARSFPAYNGSLDFVDVTAERITPEIDRLTGLSGRLLFKPDEIEVPAMGGVYRGVEFDARGGVRSFKTMDLDAEIRTAASVSEVVALIPETDRSWLKGIEVSGACDTLTEITGSLREGGTLRARHRLELRGAALHDPSRSIDITNLSCRISSDDAGTEINHARFSLGGAIHTLSGYLPKTAGQPGHFSLNTGDLALSAKYQLGPGPIRVRSGEIAYSGLQASFEGTLESFDRPDLDLKGLFKADLGKLVEKLAEKDQGLKELGLSGTLSGPFLLKGPAKEWMRWDLQADGRSPRLFVRRTLKLDDFELQLRMRDGALNLPYLHADPYKGSFGGQFSMRLGAAPQPFTARLFANQIDLGALIADLDTKNKDLRGTATMQLDLSGRLGKPETFIGGGTIDIRKGHLWKTDLFKQMGELPFVKVLGLAEVLFTDMSASFTVKDRRVWTEDLSLLSETVELLLQGSVGFDKTLDMVMNIGYSKGILDGALDTGGIVPFVIREASNMISRYKITGTLDAPKNEKILVPEIGAAVGKVARTLTGS